MDEAWESPGKLLNEEHGAFLRDPHCWIRAGLRYPSPNSMLQGHGRTSVTVPRGCNSAVQRC
jgi:hypothetical protein